jgi:hypothetical protein
MTKGTSSLGAVCTLASMSILGFLACSTVQVAPASSVHLPVIEQEVFVDLPGQTTLTTEELLAQYRRGRRTISHVRQRCLVKANCTETTDVRISAVEGAKYVNWDKGPKRPQLIAWIENLGNRKTYDEIEPMTSAVYALVVDAQPKANPEIVLVRFSSTRAGEKMTASRTHFGQVDPCHNYGQPYISDADFQPCTPYPFGKPYAILGMGALHSLNAHAIFGGASTAVALTASDPTWFSCSSGCCSAAN